MRKSANYSSTDLIMFRFRFVIIGFVLLPVAVFALEFTRVFLRTEWLVWNGYHVSLDPAEVAKIAAEKRDPQQCQKLRHADSFLNIAPGSTEESDQAECIYITAKILGDPAMCKLLLPSDYGIRCIENILPPVQGPSIGLNCEDRGGKMLCYSSYNALLAQKQDVIIDFSKCEKITDVNKRDWCYIGRVRTMALEKDCSRVILNQDHQDFCLYTLAMKMKDRQMCTGILSTVRRTACELLLADSIAD